MVSIDITEHYGWQHHVASGITVWFKGYLFNSSVEELAASIPLLETVDAIKDFLYTLDGHFAFVAQMDRGTLAAVDRVRSIPLFYARETQAEQWRLDDQAKRLASRFSYGLKDINPDAAISIAMAGYTIDRDTLYRDLHQLAPGDFVFFHNNDKTTTPHQERYYIYAPWRDLAPTTSPTIDNLASITLSVFEKLVKSANGRTIIIPLSAGMDSRLVVSALCHLKYPNIKCFSYGRSGNFEARTAELIAQRLGVPWRFVPITHSAQQRALASTEHQEYLSFADSCSSVPFKQDFLALKILIEGGWIPDDAIIVNGNSGDFITGGHIAIELSETSTEMSWEQRQNRIIGALVKKHYSLWDCLKTKKNIKLVQERLLREIDAFGAKADDPARDYGVYEYSEFNNRQCKYVITGQRIYEFLGYEWRLPLWDNDYLDFWEHAPLDAKIGQRLYQEMLEHENWGGVWKNIPVNKKTIRPLWVLPLRLLAKVLHAPLGSERWHRFERRYFYYWMDNLYGYAPYAYSQVAKDNRGARHTISWYAESYLNTHGLAFDGTPLTKK